MPDNPLVPRPDSLPAFDEVNALRRRVEGRLRSIDMLRWEGVSYGPHELHTLRMWELNDLAPRDGWACLVMLHGGGWTEGSATDFESLAPRLGRKGIMVCAANYRLAPAHRWPAQLEDVERILDFLEHQQVDRRRIAFWGHSAGGQMAALAAIHHPDRVRCAVALGAPMDLRGRTDLDHVFPAGGLDAASPVAQVHDEMAPVLLVHGTADPVCSIDDARAMARHPKVDLVEVDGGDHALRWPLLGARRGRRHARQWVTEALDLQSRGSKWKWRKKKKR